MTEEYYQRRARMRREQMKVQKSECEKEYPDCSRCAFYKEVNGRIPACALGTKAKDWDI